MGISDLDQVTSDTSSAEIREYAKSVMADIEADRRGETDKKSDAQQPGDETLAEEKSGSKTATKNGEESGKSDEAEWLTDDVKAEAATYGIDDADLAEFASREELDKALRLLDKSALKAGREALAKGEDSQSRDEKGQFAKKDSQPDKPQEETQKDGRYEVSLSKEVYDEEIINEFARMRDHYESRLEAVEQRLSVEKEKADEQQFDGFVDSLGHSDLFGTTGKESEKELERRHDLAVAVSAQVIGLQKMGRPAEMSKQLVERVARMLFGEELEKKRIKQQTQKLMSQSNKRMGGSPTKPIKPSDDPRERAARRYQSMSGNDN